MSGGVNVVPQPPFRLLEQVETATDTINREGMVLRQIALFILVCSAAAQPAETNMHGSVLTETRSPVSGARISVRSASSSAAVWIAVTGVRGEFALTVPAPGHYAITIEREGFFALRDQPVETPLAADLTFTLTRARELLQAVEVAAGTPHALDLEATGVTQTLSNTDIVNAPYPNTNDLRSALRIVPGVIRDTRGAIHLHGSAEEQVLYTLNGFNLSDPLTGRFETRMSVESVQSIELMSGALPAEQGKGAAGVMAIRTISGDDRLRASATNFFPGFENRKGLILGDWTPRAGLSGPIRKGRIWFSDSVDLQYTKTVIQDLPREADRTSSFRWSNLLHTQTNIRPGNIFYTSFLATGWNAPRSGLGPLDPLETTIDRRTRQWFFSARDQAYLPGGMVLEFGYAANRTFGREIPQGQELLAIGAAGRSGNAFVDAERRGGRDQLLVNGFLPSFQLAGSHQLKGGFDLNRVNYWQSARRTGFENLAESGAVLRRTVYQGNGDFGLRNHETAMYLQDSWRPRPGLSFELGLRADWDNALRRWDVSPRAGFAWSPPGLRDTKFAAGFGRVFDATNLRMFTRPRDQFPVTTYFGPADGLLIRGPEVTLFTIQDARPARPRHNNWNASLERHWTGVGLSLRADYIRRRGARGFSYNHLALETLSPFERLLALTNRRNDRYDGFTVSARQHLRRQYEWSASYTRSRARTNTVVDLFADETARVEDDNSGALPWDAPHRFLWWGYLPLPRRHWAVAALADYRTGFPFNASTEDGVVMSPVSAQRFPVFFEANLHLERQFELRGHRWAFRFGFNNLTNRRNPTAVYNVIGTPLFGQFHGGVGRAGNFRIRWLGRA